MFNEIKTIIVESTTECPTCGEKLNKNDKLYFDNYRMITPENDCVCQHCLEDYKKEVISEEGIDGRLLK